MYATKIPDAIEQASSAANESQSQYIKNSIVMRLQKDGFLTGEKVVTNRNKQKHLDKIQRLKEYIAAEEAKHN